MSRPGNLEDILAKIPNVKQTGDHWIGDCPAPGHKTPTGHLTLAEAGDKALVTCQGGRHSYQDICQALEFDSLNYSDKNGKCTDGDISNGNTCYSVTPPSNRIQNTVTLIKTQSVMGITVQQIAEAKRLPTEFLRTLGLTDFKYCGQISIKIPYYSESGSEEAMRYRTALTGENRFRWKKGSHPIPYGLNRLIQIRKQGWVLVVEGESDCWTLWHHNIPALGAPGKGIWPPAWGEYLKGLDVFIWQEPDAEDFVLRILKSAPEARYIIAPQGIKDISEAHIKGLDVPVLIDNLKRTAQLGRELKARFDNEQLRIAYNEAKYIIESEDPLRLVSNEIRNLGYGGDIKPALITYLSATSRLLAMRTGAMPVHLLILGAPSSGKSYTVNVVLSLLPSEAYNIVDAGSPRVLIYDDSDLQHKVVIFSESDSLPAGEDNPAASAIRNLLQDHHLHYKVTIRNQETGDFIPREIDKPGPTVLITTGVKSLGSQLMSRMFSLEVPDSKEQLISALGAQAKLEINGVRSPDSQFKAFQAYLQLKTPWNVVVPFAAELSEAIGRTASASRILRDYQRLLSLIKTVTILRHNHRILDKQGRLISTKDDYETVRELVNDMYVDTTTGINSEIRKLVGAVVELNASRGDGDSVSVTKLSKCLGISKMAASRRAHKAMAQDWIVNREQRKGFPADYITGEPMPEAQGLPDLSILTSATEEALSQNESTDGVCNAVTASTDGNIPFPIDTTPDYPVRPCYGCGSQDYWLRKGSKWGKAEWLCSICYPKSKEAESF
jgi:hypothetical protein